MRTLALTALAALLAGCASTSRVTLFTEEGGARGGAVAVFDPKTGQEVGDVTTINGQARLGGGKVHARVVDARPYADLLARVPPAPRHYVLYFYEGTTTLTSESRPILEALRKVVDASSEVEITGHTDTVGTMADNDKLSYDRAVEVRAALVKEGLPVANAHVAGRGERELLVPTADGVAEPANRRVEVILR